MKIISIVHIRKRKPREGTKTVLTVSSLFVLFVLLENENPERGRKPIGLNVRGGAGTN